MRWSPLLLLVSCNSQCQEIETPDDAQLSVIVLVVDGIRHEESLGNGYSSAAGTPSADLLPNIRSSLVPLGAEVHPAYSVGITVTAPSHSDLLTSHRQGFANYATGDDGVAAYRPELPTIFESLRDGGLETEETILIGNSWLIEPLKQSIYPGHDSGALFVMIDQAQADDAAVLDQIQEMMTRYAPRLVVANLHAVDRAGHYGKTGAYVERIERVDDPIVEFWEWIQRQDQFADQTILVVTSDHGRHRDADLEEGWRGHGDQCAGCREVPMLLVGPGIQEGVSVETRYTLEDLGMTIAWLLDTPMPYATGIVMEDILTSPPEDTNRTGTVWPSFDGEHQATTVFGTEPRTVIHLDNEPVSDAFFAENPQLLNNFACWREFELDPDVIDDETRGWPWRGACSHHNGEAWEDIGFPVDTVWPMWHPALAQGEDETIWMAIADNPRGLVDGGPTVRILRWDAVTGWDTSPQRLEGMTFPAWPSLVVDDNGTAIVAFAASEPEEDARYSRRIEVWEHNDETGWTTLYTAWPRNWEDEEIPVDRLERPALWQRGEAVYLAFVGYDEDGTISMWQTESDDGGVQWNQASRVDTSGRILGHTAPLWDDDGGLWWAELTAENTVSICRDNTCQDTESSAILGFDLDDDQAVISVDRDGVWTVEAWPRP